MAKELDITIPVPDLRKPNPNPEDISLETLNRLIERQ